MKADASGTVLHFASLPSTNLYCMEHAQTLEHATVVLADEQTGGRGRCGRSWYSPAGLNLYCTILLKAPFLGTNLTTFPQVAALAAYDAVQGAGVKGAWIKWPNDICVGDQKLAGILCESQLTGGEASVVVVGFGVNLNMDRNELAKIDRPATSILVETGNEQDRDTFVQALYTAFEMHYLGALSDGHDYIQPRWEAAERLAGRVVTVVTPSEQIRGTVDGFEPNGAIRLRLTGGTTQVFHAGEVSLRPQEGTQQR